MDSRDFPLSATTKQVLFELLFDAKFSLQEFQKDPGFGGSYLEYYQKTIESCKAHSTAQSHGSIASLVSLLKQPDANRTSVESAIEKELSDEELEDSNEIIEDSVNLAVRLLLMMPTGVFLTPGRSITVSGDTKLTWKEGTIIDLVGTEISPQTMMGDNVKLEKIFNARNLERIAGIEIRWTSNLADHLRMRDEDSAVEIFHYASFLRLHQQCHMPLLEWQRRTLRMQTRPILPAALIDETLRTLALLLPEHDKDVEDWFGDQQKTLQKRKRLSVDSTARECGQLKVGQRRIENFNYWHDRLVILKQVFDEAEPSNINQWWHDRRKRVQWYTFWIAAVVLGLTILFGLIQCVEGGIQIYYSAHPAK